MTAIRSSDDDPFACFDDDDDDSGNEGETNQKQAQPKQTHPSSADQAALSSSLAVRDDTCGVLAFHAGTEVALLQFLKQQAAKYWRNQQSLKSLSEKLERAKRILDWIDEFCLQRHWMMHIGSEKAEVLRQFICDCLKANHANIKIPIFIELGTYCGYSAIFIVKTVLEQWMGESQRIERFQLYTVEVVEHHVQVATEIIQLAGLEAFVQVLWLKESNGETLTSKLESHMGKASSIDFLFLDHDKSMYLYNLQELEASGWIKKGTHVAADNVIFAKIDDYREYMRGLAKIGAIETHLEEGFIEYSQPERHGKIFRENEHIKDGIELSVYKRDPPRAN